MANDMYFCPGCGQPLQPGSSFCPKCGRKLNPNASSKPNGLSFSKIKDSVSELGKQAKESKVGAAVSSAASDAFSKINEGLNPKNGRKPNAPLILILLGLYLVFFFDLYLGLLLLIPALIYIIFRKVNHEKAEKVVATVKEKTQPITSRPLLKHGLITLLAGIVVWRILGLIPGLILMGLSIVFLALTKFAPAIAQKIDNGCMGLFDKLNLKKVWKHNWVKIAVLALLLLVPILGIRPGPSVYGIAQSDHETSFYGSTSGSSHHVHSSSCVNVRFENNFFSGNTFYLGEDVMVKNLCGHKINKLTIEVYIHGEIPPYEKRTKTVHEYNLMPGKEVRAGSLRMSEDNIPEIISISVE